MVRVACEMGSPSGSEASSCPRTSAEAASKKERSSEADDHHHAKVVRAADWSVSSRSRSRRKRRINWKRIALALPTRRLHVPGLAME